nr:structural maintenance of chromosomes protein 2-like; partial [Biomphalaria glabrata]
MTKGKLKPEDEQTIRENYFLLREELDAKDLVEYLCQHKVLDKNERKQIISKKLKWKRNDLLLSLILNAGPGDEFQLFMRAIEEHFKDLHSRLQEIARQKIWLLTQLKKVEDLEREKEQYDQEKAEWTDNIKKLQETNSVQSKRIEDQEAQIQREKEQYDQEKAEWTDNIKKLQETNSVQSKKIEDQETQINLLTDEKTKLKDEIKKYKEEEQVVGIGTEIQNSILKGLRGEKDKILKKYTETKKNITPDERIAVLEKRLQQLISVRPVKNNITYELDKDAKLPDSNNVDLFQEDESLPIHAVNSLLNETYVLRELVIARENWNFALEQKLEKKGVLEDVLEKEIYLLSNEIGKLNMCLEDRKGSYLREKRSLEGKLLAEENKNLVICKHLEVKKSELQERLRERNELIQLIDKNFNASILMGREKTQLEVMILDKDNKAEQLNKRLEENTQKKLEFENVINNLEKLYKTSSEEMHQLQEERQKLAVELKDKENEKNILLKENEQYKIQIQQNKSNIQDLEHSCKETEAIRDTLLKEIKQMQSSLVNKENITEELKSQLDKINLQLNELTTEKIELEAKIKSSESEKSQLVAEKSQLEGQNFEQSNTILALKKKIRFLMREIEKLNLDLIDLSNHRTSQLSRLSGFSERSESLLHILNGSSAPASPNGSRFDILETPLPIRSHPPPWVENSRPRTVSSTRSITPMTTSATSRRQQTISARPSSALSGVITPRPFTPMTTSATRRRHAISASSSQLLENERQQRERDE